MDSNGKAEVRGVSRRALIAGAGAVAGAAWVTPTVISLDAAAAASSLAAVVTAGFVHVQGNAATFQSKDMPVGTFTTLVLVTAITADNQGSTGPTSAQPTTVSTPGWTLVTQLNDGVAPGVSVFQAAPNAAPPAVSNQNLQSGRLTAVVMGWTVGTTVVTSTIASATAPATSLTVPTVSSGVQAATWVFAGSASDGSSNGNWATLPSANWSPVVVPDVGGSNNTPPDLYVARNNSLLTSIGPLTETFFQTGSSGTDYGAKGLFIGVK